MRHMPFAVGAAVVLATSVGALDVQAQPFDAVVVFGDSLSDNGNLSLALGLPQRMRFTTNPGLVTLEVVAAHYGLPLAPSLAGGTDFAFDGAGIVRNWPPVGNTSPLVPTQVGGYLSAHPTLDPRSLYSVWGGADDVIYHTNAVVLGAAADQLIAQATPGLSPEAAVVLAAAIRAGFASLVGIDAVETPTQATAALTAAAQQEADLIKRMNTAGARHVVVFNLPDIGLTPEARAGGPAVQATFTAQASTFNAQLNGALAGQTGVVPVNTFALIREVLANPAAYGFENATTPACILSNAFDCTAATLVQPNAGSTFVFADGIHPTTATHALLADAVIAELGAPGQMSLLAETPLAALQRQRAIVAGVLAADAAAGGSGVSVFADGEAGSRKLDADVNAPGSRADERALTGGAVWNSGGALSLGAALTAADDTTRVSGALGRFETREVAGSVFGGWRRGATWAGAVAALGEARYRDIERSFSLGAARRTERSHAQGSNLGIELAAGHWFDIGGLKTGPFAALAYDRAHVEAISEDGGDATALWFGPQTREAVVSRLGWKLRGSWQVAGVTLQPDVTAAWAHDYRADQRFVRAGLTTMNGEFAMPAFLTQRDWGEAALGVNASLGAGIRGHLGYQGRFGRDSHENLGVIAVSYSF